MTKVECVQSVDGEALGLSAEFMLERVGTYHDPKARFFREAMQYLHTQWPHSVTVTPSTFGTALPMQQGLFVEIIQDLIDEGLVSVECLVIGSTSEPMARDVVLTRKGTSVRLEE